MNDSAIYAPLVFSADASEWHPVPVTFTPEAASAIDALMLPQSPNGHGLFFVTYDRQPSSDPYLIYLRKAGAPGKLEELGNFEGVWVYRLLW